MTEILPKLIDVLLRYRESSYKATKSFQRLKHNKHLCPALERQLNLIVDCYIKYRNIAYDVQGIHDRGTDVLLRYYEDGESEESKERLIAFQVKSFEDMNSSKYLKDLKAQCFEAQKEYEDRLVQYYILLCTDKSAHENRVREVKKNFGASSGITVIDPAYAWAFLQLNFLGINAAVDFMLREDDYVHKKARKALEGLTPTEVAITLTIVSELTFHANRILNFEEIQTRKFIREIFKKVPDYPRGYYFFLGEKDYEYIDGNSEDFKQDIEDIEDMYGVKWVRGEFKPPANRGRDLNTRFKDDLDVLDGQLFSIQCASGKIDLHSDLAHPIQAVLFDGLVRYGYKNDDLLDYVFNSLGIPQLFELKDLE